MVLIFLNFYWIDCLRIWRTFRIVCWTVDFWNGFDHFLGPFWLCCEIYCIRDFELTLVYLFFWNLIVFIKMIVWHCFICLISILLHCLNWERKMTHWKIHHRFKNRMRKRVGFFFLCCFRIDWFFWVLGFVCRSLLGSCVFRGFRAGFRKTVLCYCENYRNFFGFGYSANRIKDHYFLTLCSLLYAF